MRLSPSAGSALCDWNVLIYRRYNMKHSDGGTSNETSVPRLPGSVIVDSSVHHREFAACLIEPFAAGFCDHD